MQITRFNIHSGLYGFRETGLTTGFHAHPALEMLIAREGTFSISTPEKSLSNLTAAVIAPNQRHAINCASCVCDLFMVEFGFDVARIFFSCCTTGILPLTPEIAETLMQDLLGNDPHQPLENKLSDERIRSTVRYLHDFIHEQQFPLEQLARRVWLSPSRFSHLFKAQTGISVQQYIVWVRLKTAFDGVIRRNLSLRDAAFAAGFYDASHISNHFKKLLGIKPSAVYNNSRIIQL